MSKHDSLHELPKAGLELLAKRFKALGEPSRLQLMMALADGEKSVSTLMEETGLGQANVSRHLHTLAAVGLLLRRKEGAAVFYKVAEESIFSFCAVMCGSVRKHLENQARVMR